MPRPRPASERFKSANSVRRRRAPLIRPSFQFRYAAPVAGGVFLFSMTLGFVLSTLLLQESRRLAISPQAESATAWMLGLVFSAAFGAVAGLGFLVWVVLAARRICGPLALLERQMNELAEGRVPQLRSLRRRDEFRELHDAFARVVRSHRVCREAELKLLEKSVVVAREAIDADGTTQVDALRRLRHHLATLRETLSESFQKGSAFKGTEAGQANGGTSEPVGRCNRRATAPSVPAESEVVRSCEQVT